MTTADTLERSELTVDGMTCAACSASVERVLSGVDGVRSAEVNFATGTAAVTHDGADEAALRAAVEGIGYRIVEREAAEEAEAERETVMWRRLVVGLPLAAAAMAISMIPGLRFDGWQWVVGALATPVVWWSGWSFHRSALVNARHANATMDTLVSIGSLASWTWSAVVLVAGLADGHVWFETGAVVVALVLLGKWLELRARRRSGDALRSLAKLGVADVTLEDGTTVPIEALAIGDRFLVRPGQKVATDGVVVDGSSAIDTSLVTGESVPVDVAPGDEVIGATINTNGSLVVEATRVGGGTMLAQITRLVEEAQGSRAPIQRLADRVAGVFVPIAIVVAVVTLVGWFVAGRDAVDAATAAVAVLIIACPCALGLATPLGIIVGTGRGAQLGVIIKGGEVLEDTRDLDVVVLDKTGTITEGRMSVRETHADQLSPGERDELLRQAAALEARSEHPIAAAIVAAAGGPPALAVTDFVNRPGLGVVGHVDGTRVAVGRQRLFRSTHPSAEAAGAAAEERGATAVYVGRGSEAEMVVEVVDGIKATSREAVESFVDLGLEVVMLTGDNERTAAAVAEHVGIEQVVAGVMPARKAAEIESLRARGSRVAMVGDGVNDAPALAVADLGIAIGTGADVALEASDLTIVSGDLLAVADAIALARRTLSTIRGNLFWAFAYNAAAIPLAAFGVLNPMIAAAAMGLSSLFVVSNSLRLRRFAGFRRH